MKKRVIVLIIAIFYTVCISGYVLLSKRMDDINRRGYIQEAQEYLATNEKFTQEYGNIISFEAIEDEGPTRSDSDEKKEYYMDFKCVTENAELEIRVYHVWNDGWSFYHVVL